MAVGFGLLTPVFAIGLALDWSEDALTLSVIGVVLVTLIIYVRRYGDLHRS